jgi:hypothetical protein
MTGFLKTLAVIVGGTVLFGVGLVIWIVNGIYVDGKILSWGLQIIHGLFVAGAIFLNYWYADNKLSAKHWGWLGTGFVAINWVCSAFIMANVCVRIFGGPVMTWFKNALLSVVVGFLQLLSFVSG